MLKDDKTIYREKRYINRSGVKWNEQFYQKMQWWGYIVTINVLGDTYFVETLKHFIVFNIYNKITEGDNLPKRKPVYHWAVHRCLYINLKIVYKTICFSSQLDIKVLKDFKFVISQMAK